MATFSKSCERDHPKYQRGLMVPNHSHNGHTRGRGSLLGGLAQAGKLMCFTHKACYYYVKGYSVGKMYLGGYLITFGVK